MQPGQALSVRFALRNLTKHQVKVSLWVFSTGLVITAADGTTYNTGAPLAALPGIPPPIPSKIRPRATKSLGRLRVPVRWSGPLQVTPNCEGKPLRVLRVAVAAPWPRPAASAVAGDVVAAAGHLLDHCRPQTPGVAVYGQIEPPSGSAPPMDAECSLSISSEGTFWVAQVLVLIPPGLAGVQIFQPYETLWPITRLVPLTSPPPYEAIAWEFVVTRAGATPVAAATLAATTRSGQGAPSFSWNDGSWKQDGTISCGATGFAWGGTGPTIEFISACPS